MQAATIDPAVDSLLQQRLINPRLGSDVGLVVIDAATGDLVSEHNADELMLPASNIKIVTAVNAIATMGDNHRFITRVRTGATPTDLVLEGGGDPLLTSTELQALAAQTAPALPAGTKVTVHVDDDLFAEPGRGPGWTNGYQPYVAAPIGALARLGDYSRDPARNAVKVFAKALRAAGVKVRIGDDVDAGPTAATVAESGDHTVADAVAVMLSRSENNVAEVLYRQVAVATGKPATWAGGRAAAEDTLRSLGIDPSGMALLDGSGLSRKARVTPRFLASVLRLARVTKADRFASIFRTDALPVAGKSGTLARAYGRYNSKPSKCARGAIQAKTGSLFDTITLSGRATTSAGQERLFSFLVNHRPQRFSALSIRQALDGLAATVVGCWH